MNELAIITECYVDTNLIETIVPPQKGYNHQMNCVKVGSVMQKNFSDRFAIGIIDKDKKTIKYLEEFNLVVDTGSLCLHKHKTKHHYIIQIAPAAERFILDAASSLETSLKNFGLSDTLEGLKNYTKHQSSKTDPNLKNAFRALKKSQSFSILANWIVYMKDKQFQIDIANLKRIVEQF